MIRYFQINGIDISGGCPKYDDCQSARGILTREFCARYGCNTVQQVDTIQLYLDSPWGPKAIANCGGEDASEKPSGIAKIVERHLQESSNHGHNGHNNGHNGNGRNGNGRADPDKRSAIAEAFPR